MVTVVEGTVVLRGLSAVRDRVASKSKTLQLQLFEQNPEQQNQAFKQIAPFFSQAGEGKWHAYVCTVNTELG